MNEKDVRDICALVLDHPLGETDTETINLARVAGVCAQDWGLWRTSTLSLDKVQKLLDEYHLEPADKATIIYRFDILRTALRDQPKSLRWKMRAQVGDKLPWYELPEEVKRG